MSQEKRRWKRLDSNLFAVIRSSGSDMKLGRGVVVDVNIHGFGLETETELSVGDVFEFDVEIPFTLRARVIRRIIPGQMKKYGLQVLGQGWVDRLMLKKLLRGNRKTLRLE